MRSLDLVLQALTVVATLATLAYAVFGRNPRLAGAIATVIGLFAAWRALVAWTQLRRTRIALHCPCGHPCPPRPIQNATASSSARYVCDECALEWSPSERCC